MYSKKKGQTLLRSKEKKRRPFKVWGVYASQLIPDFINKCLNFFLSNAASPLKTPGIFRQPGNHEAVQLIKRRVEKNKKLDFSVGYSPHDVASAFKQFFSDGESPLLTFELHDCFIAVAGVPGEPEQLECLLKVLRLLPSENVSLLKCLLRFLRIVLQHSE